MNSPLFNMLGGMPGGNNPMQMIQSFLQFKNTFRGDPRAEVQKLIQSGKISQSQLDQAQNMARELQALLSQMNQ
ncbi:MAG: hypothetical protein KBT03_03865 [Bacteroidales bacterium]|nr:hypothetical protein [Candidatus Scybalousia scybalohippi]